MESRTKVCKNQKMREFAVRLCILVMSQATRIQSVTFLKTLFVVGYCLCIRLLPHISYETLARENTELLTWVSVFSSAKKRIPIIPVLRSCCNDEKFYVTGSIAIRPGKSGLSINGGYCYSACATPEFNLAYSKGV